MVNIVFVRPRWLRWLVPAMLAVAMGPALAGNPAETVDAFHQALRHQKADEAMSLLDTQVIIFEQGFITDGAEAFRNGSLTDAMGFEAQTRARILHRESFAGDSLAWVMSTVLTSGIIDGQRIDWLGTETAVLRKQGSDWRIQHLHWSSHVLEPAERKGYESALPPDPLPNPDPAPEATAE